MLTDIEMPGLDGYGLAAEIRRLEAAGGAADPDLAITASDFDLDERARRPAWTATCSSPSTPIAGQKAAHPRRAET